MPLKQHPYESLVASSFCVSSMFFSKKQPLLVSVTILPVLHRSIKEVNWLWKTCWINTMVISVFFNFIIFFIDQSIRNFALRVSKSALTIFGHACWWRGGRVLYITSICQRGIYGLLQAVANLQTQTTKWVHKYRWHATGLWQEYTTPSGYRFASASSPTSSPETCILYIYTEMGWGWL